MFYIYCSQSYTCYDTEAPDGAQLEAIRLGYLRALRVEGAKLFGLRKDGQWREIVKGDPLRQVIYKGCPLPEGQTE